jgi:hypothetical protein
MIDGAMMGKRINLIAFVDSSRIYMSRYALCYGPVKFLFGIVDYMKEAGSHLDYWEKKFHPPALNLKQGASGGSKLLGLWTTQVDAAGCQPPSSWAADEPKLTNGRL